VTNPTSNYNFQMPTATDLVTDLPADFEVFGQAVDTRLKALQPGTTLGDLAYSSATANTNTRLGIGTTNQVLSVVGGVPAWATPAAGAYTTIASGSLPTGSALAITSIAGTYQKLVLIIRNAVTSGNSDIRVRFNNDATAGAYCFGRSEGVATSATMTNTIVSSTAVVALNFGTDDVANNMTFILSVDNYASAASNKLFNFQDVYSTNTTDYRTELGWGGYKSNTAISQINVTNTDFTAGTYILYGVA